MDELNQFKTLVNENNTNTTKEQEGLNKQTKLDILSFEKGIKNFDVYGSKKDDKIKSVVNGMQKQYMAKFKARNKNNIQLINAEYNDEKEQQEIDEEEETNKKEQEDSFNSTMETELPSFGEQSDSMVGGGLDHVLYYTPYDFLHLPEPTVIEDKKTADRIKTADDIQNIKDVVKLIQWKDMRNIEDFNELPADWKNVINPLVETSKFKTVKTLIKKYTQGIINKEQIVLYHIITNDFNLPSSLFKTDGKWTDKIISVNSYIPTILDIHKEYLRSNNIKTISSVETFMVENVKSIYYKYFRHSSLPMNSEQCRYLAIFIGAVILYRDYNNGREIDWNDIKVKILSLMTWSNCTTNQTILFRDSENKVRATEHEENPWAGIPEDIEEFSEEETEIEEVIDIPEERDMSHLNQEDIQDVIDKTDRKHYPDGTIIPYTDLLLKDANSYPIHPPGKLQREGGVNIKDMGLSVCLSLICEFVKQYLGYIIVIVFLLFVLLYTLDNNKIQWETKHQESIQNYKLQHKQQWI
jgi:hypothetical protein